MGIFYITPVHWAVMCFLAFEAVSFFDAEHYHDIKNPIKTRMEIKAQFKLPIEVDHKKSVQNKGFSQTLLQVAFFFYETCYFHFFPYLIFIFMYLP